MRKLLTLADREEISRGLAAGRRLCDIAAVVGRDRSVISPLTRTGRDGESSVVLGPRTETVFPHAELLSEVLAKRSEPWLELPLSQVALHMAVVAQTGAGKTTLLERVT
ncbi:helix-turn-helix domain-containing protein [Pseudonocardia sp. ICBG601]|uniref:helix-turn-helix domain-containing protein n=1 Tax=Pseudonocardia sp. ICBG601 TaxID=2846759 RepID=UPI001CF6FCDC|nr:helix-turn-helix domain-containing protein [Pseudonocardia sp. ICBG601]